MNLYSRERSEPGLISLVSFQMGTRLRSWLWVLIVLVGILGPCGIGSVCAQNRRPKNVQVAVRAKWSGTPLILEAGYVAFLFCFALFFILFMFCNFFLYFLFCYYWSLNWSISFISCYLQLNPEMGICLYVFSLIVVPGSDFSC